MLVILTGKSGCGKDTLQEELIRKENFKKLISTTTRPKREGEIEGREYHFVDKDKFLQLEKENFFIEHRTYKTLVEGNPDVWYYGLGKQISKEEISNPDKDYITILDLDGAREAINYYGEDNCITVFINVDDKLREERASKRGGFDKTEWDRRLADDNIKFSKTNMRGLIDLRLDNNLDFAVSDFAVFKSKFLMNYNAMKKSKIKYNKDINNSKEDIDYERGEADNMKENPLYTYEPLGYVTGKDEYDNTFQLEHFKIIKWSDKTDKAHEVNSKSFYYKDKQTVFKSIIDKAKLIPEEYILKRLFKEHKEVFIFTKQSLTNRLIHYTNDYAKTKPVPELSAIIFGKFLTGQIAIKVNNEKQHNVLINMLKQVNENFVSTNRDYDTLYSYYTYRNDYVLLGQCKTLRDVCNLNFITKYVDFDNPDVIMPSGEKINESLLFESDSFFDRYSKDFER